LAAICEDHDLHQGWFMMFSYHCGKLKFDVQIFDGTQCQKKYYSACEDPENLGLLLACNDY
jgi:hypothetical protein